MNMFYLDSSEFFHGGSGRLGGDAWVDDGGQEGDGAHHGVARLAERDRLVCQRTKHATLT